MTTTPLTREVTPLEEFLERCDRYGDRAPSQLLGVNAGADPASVRAAFLALARRFHPDADATAGPEERERLQAAFVRLTAAYQALGGHRVVTPGGDRKSEPGSRPKPVVVAPSPVTVPTQPAPRAAPAPTAPRVLDPGERRDRVRNAIEEAQALLARHDNEGTVRVLHQVVTLAEGQEQRQIRLLLARAYLADSQWRRYGVALLRELTQEEPSCGEALALMGGVYLSQGLLARAESTLLLALDADPANAEARKGLRSVRAALIARHSPAPEPARTPGLLARLFSKRRQEAKG